MSVPPPRNYGVTLKCAKCGRPFVTRQPRIYCSAMCRQAAGRDSARRACEGAEGSSGRARVPRINASERVGATVPRP